MITLIGRIDAVVRGDGITPNDDILQRQLQSTASHIKDIQIQDIYGQIVGRGQFDTLDNIPSRIYCLLIRLNPISDRLSPDSLLLLKENRGINRFRRIGVLASERREIQSLSSPGSQTSTLPPFFRQTALEQVILV